MIAGYPIPEYLHSQWEKWRQEIEELKKLEIQRCFKPNNFGPVKAVEMHYFSDASIEGYDQCSYLRLINEHDIIFLIFYRLIVLILLVNMLQSALEHFINLAL